MQQHFAALVQQSGHRKRQLSGSSKWHAVCDQLRPQANYLTATKPIAWGKAMTNRWGHLMVQVVNVMEATRVWDSAGRVTVDIRWPDFTPYLVWSLWP